MCTLRWSVSQTKSSCLEESKDIVCLSTDVKYFWILLTFFQGCSNAGKTATLELTVTKKTAGSATPCWPWQGGKRGGGVGRGPEAGAGRGGGVSKGDSVHCTRWGPQIRPSILSSLLTSWRIHGTRDSLTSRRKSLTRKRFWPPPSLPTMGWPRPTLKPSLKPTSVRRRLWGNARGQGTTSPSTLR